MATFVTTFGTGRGTRRLSKFKTRQRALERFKYGRPYRLDISIPQSRWPNVQTIVLGVQMFVLDFVLIFTALRPRHHQKELAVHHVPLSGGERGLLIGTFAVFTVASVVFLVNMWRLLND